MAQNNLETYTLRLDENLTADYEQFRKENSKDQEYRVLYKKDKTISCPVVYKQSTEFAYFIIEYTKEEKLKLLINLQNYYVFGFIFEDICYAFDNKEIIDNIEANTSYEKDKNLVLIPYGDAYFEIGEVGKDTSILDNTQNEQVTAKRIIDSIDYISSHYKTDEDWENNREHILRIFWALIEGIRFKGISNIVQSLFNNDKKDEVITYESFYYMAERWEKLSIGSIYQGKIDNSIAVYDIRPLFYLVDLQG